MVSVGCLESSITLDLISEHQSLLKKQFVDNLNIEKRNSNKFSIKKNKNIETRKKRKKIQAERKKIQNIDTQEEARKFFLAKAF